MSEWFKELVLKTSDSQEPWVRIPLSPPQISYQLKGVKYVFNKSGPKETYLGEEMLNGGKPCKKCMAYPKIRRWKDYAGIIKVQYLCSCDRLPIFYYLRPEEGYDKYVSIWNFVYA